MKTVKVLSVYSVVYFLAFVVKTQGLSLLSSFLFLFLAVFLYCVEKKEEKNCLPLCGLFALGLLGGEGIAVLQLSRLSLPWSNTMWLSLYLAYFCFYLSYHLFPYIVSFPEKRERERSAGQDAKFLKRCILFLLGISYLSFSIEAISLGYIPLFTENTPHAYSYFHLKGLHYFTTLFVLVPMLLPCLYKLEKKIGLFSYISFFLSLLLPILLVSRYQLIFSILLFLFSLLLEGYRPKWRKVAVLFLFLGVCYVVLTIERAHSVSYLLDIFEMKNRNIPIVLVQPYMYVANNFENLNLLTLNLATHSNGFKMAYPFLTLSGLKFFIEFPLAYPLYLTKEELSTLTILYDAYYDFGLLGVVLFSAVLGGMGEILYALQSVKKNPFLSGIVAQFSFYLLFSFFTTWFSNASSIFYFGVSIFFAILWQRKEEKRTKQGKEKK